MNSSMLIFKNAAAAEAGGFASTAFVICLVLGCVCLALAVLFFFIFDIPRVYLVRTGKGARKTIKKMEEINAQTGRLRRVNEEYMLSEDAPLTGDIGHTPSHDISSTPQMQGGAEGNATTVLGQQIETTVLSNNETTVLNGGVQNNAVSSAYSYQRKTSGKFDVVTNIVMTHSDEII
ncbi:MAG: hypothetical protein E7578_00360 [Ruminococcaceae bacterium]|nr:hypothetical protein [Oscillospiraceae bacterium]